MRLASTARGHEFHYSTLVPEAEGSTMPVHSVMRGGAEGLRWARCGQLTLALYTHVHFASQPQIAKALVSSVRWTQEV